MKTPVTRIFPRVGRVIPNAPLRHDSQTDVKLPVTPNRRVKDNAPSLDPRAAFTLIEMIGVMAVMAILATVLVPNVLKSIERAAVRAEAETLNNLGEQTKLYLRDTGNPPNSASSNPPTTLTSWNTQIATYASLNASDILNNKRQMQRVYVTEPAVFPALPQRALIISSMRSGILRQVSTTETTQDVANYVRANITRFNDVWNWNTSATPLVAPPGWGAWNQNNIEFLVIERINFVSVYRADQSHSVQLNNSSIVRRVSYRISAIGAPPGGGLPPTINQTSAAPLITLTKNQQLYLYNQDTGLPADLDYIHLSSGSGSRSFAYVDNADGTNGRWIPVAP